MAVRRIYPTLKTVVSVHFEINALRVRNVKESCIVMSGKTIETR